MAERKFTPFPVIKGNKAAVYESLHNLNLAFEFIAANIARLNDKAIPRPLLDLYILQAEEIRAGIAHLLTSVLHRRESVDWAHYGRKAEELRKRQTQIKVSLPKKSRALY
jgi:hypothetical protein